MIKNNIASLVENTILYKPVKKIYGVWRQAKLPFKKFYYDLRYSEEEFAKINVPEESIDPFYLDLPEEGPSRYRRMFGEWEPKVMRELASEISEETIYWEFGGAWGYFSIAIAPNVKECYSFETMEERVSKINKSIEKNEYDNIEAICGTVGKNIDLKEYPVPDLLLMDVEGFEYEILDKHSWLLENSTTFIIEVHTEESHIPQIGETPNMNPNGVINLLKDKGYEVSQIDEGKNYHIKAEPN